MSAERVRAPTAPRRRAASRAAPAGRTPEHAQLVWRRAVDLAGPSSTHDRFARAIDLLRAAHHGPATMAHALNLGRGHLDAHPEDALAPRGVAILEEAIAFLGVKPLAYDVVGASG